jgi:hypothetical protein
MLRSHRDSDVAGTPEAAREAKQIERLRKEAAQMRQWLAEHPEDRKGSRNKVRLSNLTDNESAKMATNKGSSRAIPVLLRSMKRRR